MTDTMVNGVEELYAPAKNDNERRLLREEEIDKLDGFGAFAAEPIPAMPAGERLYRHTWVDTEEKSRLTVKDLRRFRDKEDQQRHCPTPSYISNSVLEYFAAATGYPMVCLTLSVHFYMQLSRTKRSTGSHQRSGMAQRDMNQGAWFGIW